MKLHHPELILARPSRLSYKLPALFCFFICSTPFAIRLRLIGPSQLVTASLSTIFHVSISLAALSTSSLSSWASSYSVDQGSSSGRLPFISWTKAVSISVVSVLICKFVTFSHACSVHMSTALACTVLYFVCFNRYFACRATCSALSASSAFMHRLSSLLHLHSSRFERFSILLKI